MIFGNMILQQIYGQEKADFGGSSKTQCCRFFNRKQRICRDSVDSTALNFFKDFWEFNPIINTWTKIADFKGGARCGAVGFSIGSEGYVGLGIFFIFGSIGYYNDFWAFDTLKSTWTKKEGFYLPREESFSVSLGGKGYTGLGYYEYTDHHGNIALHYYADFWQYNPDDDHTGISEQNTIKNNIKIYQSNSSINIESTENLNEVIIIDLLGQEVMRYENKDVNKRIVSINGLKQGLYFAEIITINHNVLVKKFVKI